MPITLNLAGGCAWHEPDPLYQPGYIGRCDLGSAKGPHRSPDPGLSPARGELARARPTRQIR